MRRIAHPRALPPAQLGAPQAPSATRVSGRWPVACGSTQEKPGAWGVFGGARRLARRSLILAGVTLSSAGCLVTSVPDYQPPEQTRPILMADTATPATWELLEFTRTGVNEPYPELPFSVEVVSEDLGVDVQAKFFLVARGALNTFQFGYAGGTLEAGSLTDTGRTLRKGWSPSLAFEPTADCYTLFWVAAHAFDAQTGCPAPAADPDTGEPRDPPRDDFSILTWTVLVCPDSTPCAATTLAKCLDGDPDFVCESETVTGGS